MKYIFNTEGICTKQYIIEVEDGRLIGLDSPKAGCPGNFLGMVSITHNMDIDTIIEKYEGIACGKRVSSCPDQLAKALKMIRNGELTPCEK